MTRRESGWGGGHMLLTANSTCAVSCAFSVSKVATTSASLATSLCAPVVQTVSSGFEASDRSRRNCCKKPAWQPGALLSGPI